MTVTIVGMGLIGGSLALDLRKRGFARRIVGVDSNPFHTDLILKRGLADDAMELHEALKGADLVVLAIPVDAIAAMLPSLLDSIGDGTVVVDVGSTKGVICGDVKHHPRRKQFVASHPIAGTENSGPAAAIHGLFDDKTAILCDVDESDEDAVAAVRRMYDVLRMRIVGMDSGAHDRHMAFVSHISHVVSFALAATVLEIEQSEATIVDLASSGLDSTVRLAKSSPDMWAPILKQNSGAISEALDSYLSHLVRFKKFIDSGDSVGTYEFMKSGNDIRRVLDGITRRGELCRHS